MPKRYYSNEDYGSSKKAKTNTKKKKTNKKPKSTRKRGY